MAGLNNIREAYQQVYSLDERMSPEEREMKRQEVADKKASRMSSKVAAKYAGSEAKSAEREDKKSRGKHIHGMADSVELEGEVLDEETPVERLDRISKEKVAARSAMATIDKAKKQRSVAAFQAHKKSVLAKGGTHVQALDSWQKMKKEEVEVVDEARVDVGLSRSEKETARNERAGITNHPLIGNKRGQNMHRTMSHIETRGEKKNRGEKEDSWWKTKFTKDKSGKISKHRDWHVSHENDRRARIEKEEFEIEEAKNDSYLETNMKKRQKNNEKARKEMMGTTAHKDMVKAAMRHFEEVELSERELDPTEKKEKERLVKGLKKSASAFKKRYGERWKNVLYATATERAKKHMDTSKSDRRYGVEA